MGDHAQFCGRVCEGTGRLHRWVLRHHAARRELDTGLDHDRQYAWVHRRRWLARCRGYSLSTSLTVRPSGTRGSRGAFPLRRVGYGLGKDLTGHCCPASSSAPPSYPGQRLGRCSRPCRRCWSLSSPFCSPSSCCASLRPVPACAPFTFRACKAGFTAGGVTASSMSVSFTGRTASCAKTRPFLSRERLGGILNYYCRAA